MGCPIELLLATTVVVDDGAVSLSSKDEQDSEFDAPGIGLSAEGVPASKDTKLLTLSLRSAMYQTASTTAPGRHTSE